MDKISAINWLKGNLNKWPSPTSGIFDSDANKPSPNGWYWVKFHTTWLCISEGAPDMYVIREQDIFTSETKVGI